MGNLSDKDIIDGIRQQDEKVLNYLYRVWFKMVNSHVLKSGGSEEDSFDVFQDSIISLYEMICDNRLNLHSDLKGYFFGISRNIWYKQMKERSRTGELDFDIAGEGEDEEDNLSDPLFMKILTRSLNKLKPDCRSVLEMFYEGKSYEEISERLNLKNEVYARRKKYLCKEALMEIIKTDPEYIEYQRFLK